MFVNEQQRNRVQQAQQAQQGFSQPQSSQMSPEVAEDDDAMLKEVFNSINGPVNTAPPISVPPIATYEPSNYYAPPAQKYQTNTMMPSVAETQNLFLTAGLFFGVSLLPIAGRYGYLDKIPNGDLAFKALLAAGVLLLIRRSGAFGL